MTTTTDWVVHSLELCAELDQDINDSVYQHFFDACPEAIALMGHSDEHMRGRMMTQVVELLMEDTNYQSGDYLDWEVENHVQAYAVSASMYSAFLPAVKAAMQQALGNQWHAEHETAWNERLTKMNTAIQEYSTPK